MKKLFILILVTGFISCKSNSQHVTAEKKVIEKVGKRDAEKPDMKSVEDEKSFKTSNGDVVEKIEKTKEEWKSDLSEIQFYVIREKGTERPFTSPLLTNKKNGVYTCGACDLPLFASDTKYKSGTGWPSFYQPVDEEVILEDTDYDLGYARTEVMCRRCEGHLGHVFKDGPDPTGLRYCINGVSLAFEESK